MAEQIDTADASNMPKLNVRRDELADIELQLLLDALLRFGGYDFRNFNQSMLRRRVADAMRAASIETISGLQDRLLHDERSLASFLISMGSGNTQLFHDPEFFKSFTANVVPLLQTYSFVRIWMPSSGTGADAYSLAALLEEAGILEKCVIYATSLNEVATAVAKTGRYEHSTPQEVQAVARQAGIVSTLTRYFEIDETHATATDLLRQNIMFARHNPAEDGSINEFHAIVARNIFPLFNGTVQYRMHRLMFDSVLHLGFVCLGRHESLANTVHEGAFRKVVDDQPIYRRMR